MSSQTGRGRTVREKAGRGRTKGSLCFMSRPPAISFTGALQLSRSSTFISLSISVFIIKIPSAHTIFLMQPGPDLKLAKAEARRARARPWPARPGNVSTASPSVSVTSRPWESRCLLGAAPDNWVQAGLPFQEQKTGEIQPDQRHKLPSTRNFRHLTMWCANFSNSTQRNHAVLLCQGHSIGWLA